MPDITVKLTAISVGLGDLLLDPNNPRFATSLKLPEHLPDSKVASAQDSVRGLFVNSDQASEAVGADDEDAETSEGKVEIGDLVRKIDQIGFVPIDQIVVRKLIGKSKRNQYVVIEGNRRVSAAKHLSERRPDPNPEERKRQEWVASTLKELDVLLLDTEGHDAEQLHHQIGVILGLRHFGSVLGWGPLAKAVNIYNEYMATEPKLPAFELDNRRISVIETRLSVPRSRVKSAIATYLAYQQLQAAFPDGGPKPDHYSLIDACVTNRKLVASGFVAQHQATFQLSAASVENLNMVCEFQTRDVTKKTGEMPNILSDPKAVSALASVIADAASNKDVAVRAFAASLKDEVLHKESTLSDAVDNLRSFKSNRAWTDALTGLLAKVTEPGVTNDPSGRQLKLAEFDSLGNEVSQLEQAQKAFKNVRVILGV